MKQTSKVINNEDSYKQVPRYLHNNGTFMRWLKLKNVYKYNSALRHFPTMLNEADCDSKIQLTHNGTRAQYIGRTSNSENKVGSVRANFSIPNQAGIFYFEVEIKDRGKKGLIGIGFCTRSVELTRLPGWDPNSWGYHGDDGNTFNCAASGTEYGPKFTTGDVIGCGINFFDNTGFYTKNGIFLGEAFDNVSGTIYPFIGLSTPDETVEINFGKKAFRYDIERYYTEQKQIIWNKIKSKNIGLELLSDTIDITKEKENEYESDNLALNVLITSYLVHHGYSDTAKKFAKNALGDQIIDNELDDNQEYRDNSVSLKVIEHVKKELESDNKVEVDNRKNVRNFILNGDIESAEKLLNEKYPDVINNQSQLMFDLHCQKFIEIAIQLENLTLKEDNNSKVEDNEIEDNEIEEDEIENIHTTKKDKRKRDPADHDGFVSKTSTRKNQLLKFISYGQQLSDIYHGFDIVNSQKTLKELFGLISYRYPSKSDLAHLLNNSKREELANKLMSAILVSQNRPPIPGLELIYRHTSTISSNLADTNCGKAGFTNVRDDILL